MLTIILVLFGVAVVLGVALATVHLRGRPTVSSVTPATGASETAPASGPPAAQVPIGLALAHGLFAAVALTLLIIAVVRDAAGGLTTIALVAFLLAALGGFYLFALHLRKQLLSRLLILVHGLAAAVGFVLLLVVVLGA